ncbi:hypothetical protein COO91_08130 [Nostoc flagelliforme CCNUN1]|uniref:Uncharacterized protein n=1 Tax=Nostoc flagelliforme CCNUN1 TaxID=2038116 RepID=A0A2K8T2Y1_9NOSO|nr:hypothetical protein COO91_08130 [Nostoc flagelliforme CCNUN1]
MRVKNCDKLLEKLLLLPCFLPLLLYRLKNQNFRKIYELLLLLYL